MNQSIWQRASTVLERSRLSQPPEQITLKIKYIKWALGISLIQSIIIAGVLAFTYHSSDAWFYPFYTLLQIGWIWDKITNGTIGSDYRPIPDIELGDSALNFTENTGSQTENIAPSVFYNPLTETAKEDESLFSTIENKDSIMLDSKI